MFVGLDDSDTPNNMISGLPQLEESLQQLLEEASEKGSVDMFEHTLLSVEEERSLGRRIKMLAGWEKKLETVLRRKLEAANADHEGKISPATRRAGLSPAEFKVALATTDKRTRKDGVDPDIGDIEVAAEEWAIECGITDPIAFQGAVSEAWSAKQLLIMANQRLVASIGKKWENRGLPFDDLIQEGELGLMIAVEGWDPDKGNRFSTYATFAIKSAMRKAVDDMSTTIRVPARMRAELRNFGKTVSDFTNTYLRPPTDDEVMKEMGIPKKKLEQLKELYAARTISLDAFESVPFSCRKPTPVEGVERSLLKEFIHHTLETRLTTLEAEVVRAYYGLLDGTQRTMPQVEELLRELLGGHSARKVLYRAMRRLRDPTLMTELQGIKEEYAF
jgi:RNA polymerase primary sigma factor